MLDSAPSPFSADGTQFAFDATTLDLAETCLRKYYYRIKRGLVPRQVSVHLKFGGIFATALEHFYKYHLGADLSIEEATLRVVEEALIASYGFDFDHKTKTRANLIRSIIWYLDEFGDESDSSFKTWIDGSGEPAVERSFQFDLGDYIICGHLDRVIQFAGDLYIADNKTTGGHVGANYFAQYDPDIQMSTYTLAGKIIFKSPIRGVIIDAAQIGVGFTTFTRGFTLRTPGKLNEYIENTIYTIERTNKANRSGFYPMNRTSCMKYSDREGWGGCPYRSLCSLEPSLRENFIKADFEQAEWNPLRAR
jgi:hypothetical protein